MRSLYLSMVFLLAAGVLSAQFSVEVLEPFDFASNFRDVHVDPSGNGWAVGTCGILAETQNNGQDWAIQSAPEGRDYDAVVCQPGTNCQTVYLLTDGLMARSTDGGESWTDISMPSSGPRELHFLQNDVVVLSHSNESLVRSVDGGDTWTEIPLEYSYRGTAHFPSETVGYLFQQSGGPLLKTTDAGASWDSVYQFEANALYGGWLDENIGFLYDQNRRIFKTTDGGSNWSLVTDTGVPSNLRLLVPLTETDLVAYVFTDNIFLSSDGGATWTNNTTISSGQFGLLFNGFHHNGDDFWIASNGTEILYSTDGLQSATSQFPADRPNYERMAFASNEVGYALRERNGLAKTTDGGDTWTHVETDFVTVSRDLLVMDEETVIVPYNSSGPQITEDGGNTWSPLFPADIQDTTYVFHIEQLPGGRLYLYGSVHGAYSDDGGDSWNVIYHGFSAFPRSMIFLDDQRGFVGSDGGRIYATTDGGESWTQVVAGDFTNQPIANLFALDDNTIMNTVSGISRCSNDGGLTWSADNCNGVSAPGEIIVAPDGTYYAARFLSSSSDVLTEIRRSTDGGLSWEDISDFCVYATPGAVTPDGRYLYLYRSSGLLARVELESVNTEDIPTREITAATVYPNPTNGLLRVELPATAQDATCSIFDLQGRQLWQQALSLHTNTLDLSNLPAGMYLLQLRGDGWMQRARVVVE